MLKLNAPVPAARFTRKSLPLTPFYDDRKAKHIQIHPQKRQPRHASTLKNDNPDVGHPLSSSSREADGLTEQPQEQRPLEHEDRVQVRPIQREPEHGDPGSVVLQVCHCKRSKTAEN